MEWVALALMATGAYLIDSGIKNRAPIGFIKTILSDPTDIVGKLEAANGKWQPLPGLPSKEEIQSAAGDKTGTKIEKGASGGTPGQSGHLTTSQLQKLSWTNKSLAPAAATALESLNKAYKAKFGTNLTVTDAYRSYAAQVRTKAQKGALAATPGYSNHGWGLAVDLGGGANSYGTAQHKWLRENAPSYGWVWPDWARKGTPLATSGSTKSEPWHWEFTSRTGSGGSF